MERYFRDEVKADQMRVSCACNVEHRLNNRRAVPFGR
jgi:hypothetical protein